MDIEQAVEEAIKYCVKEGILADFLLKYRREAKDVSITEYNHEKTMQMLREESYEDGKLDGRQEGRQEGEIQMLIKVLNDFCKIPAELEEQIRRETDNEKLTKCRRAIMETSKEELIDKIAEILNE